MDSASEAILALKPVTFHYKSEAKGTVQFGLIVEDVAEVNPDLVVREEKGEIYTARYDAVNAMLLNEFLKEHRKVEEQGAIIAKQQKQIEALTALNGPPEIAQAPMEMTYFVQGVPAEPEGRQLLARSSTGEAPERANQRQVTEVLQSLT